MSQKPWEELKAKLPLKVKWSSDGVDGEGVLYEMDITDIFVEFKINDSKVQEPFSLSSNRKLLGSHRDVNGLHIAAPYMGQIDILPGQAEGLLWD